MNGCASCSLGGSISSIFKFCNGSRKADISEVTGFASITAFGSIQQLEPFRSKVSYSVALVLCCCCILSLPQEFRIPWHHVEDAFKTGVAKQ